MIASKQEQLGGVGHGKYYTAAAVNMADVLALRVGTCSRGEGVWEEVSTVKKGNLP